MSGSNRRNWSSVRAWPEPKSPTSARSAGVHRAVSKQKPPATPPDRQDQPVKPAPSPLCKRALSPASPLRLPNAVYQIERVQQLGRHRYGAIDAPAALLQALEHDDTARQIDPIGR